MNNTIRNVRWNLDDLPSAHLRLIALGGTLAAWAIVIAALLAFWS